jgi:hypothetical protein
LFITCVQPAVETSFTLQLVAMGGDGRRTVLATHHTRNGHFAVAQPGLSPESGAPGLLSSPAWGQLNLASLQQLRTTGEGHPALCSWLPLQYLAICSYM